MAVILLIDDEKFILRALSQMIEAIGHNVVTAISGYEAREFFKPGAFDIVIADLNLPDCDGLTLLREFMAKDEDIKTVMITGFSTIQVLAQATNEGVNAYITKPFSMGEITSTLNRLIREDTQPATRSPQPDAEENDKGIFSRVFRKWRPSA